MDTALARMTAVGRIAFGAAFMANPRAAMRTWIGRDADRPAAQVLSRALGARDLVLGVGALAALGDRDLARRWLAAAMVADATDLAATLIHREELPKGGRDLVIAIASGAVLIGAKVALFPDRPAPQ